MTASHSDLLERARKHLIRYCRTWQPPFIVSGRRSTVTDIAATVTSPEIEARAVENGFFHITSHVSDPMPSLVGLAVLDLIVEEKLADAARTQGDYFVS